MINLPLFKFWAKEDERDYKEQVKTTGESISAPMNDDGAIEYETAANQPYSGMFQQFYTQDTSITNTRELINSYRALMRNPEVENAVSQIVNDAIIHEKGHKVVSINLEATKFSDSVKAKILEEFDRVCSLLNMSRKASTHFKRWYIDSRIFFHKIVKNPKDGIIELRQLDPRNMEYYREVITKDVDNTKVVVGYKEFFLYKTGDAGYSYNGTVYSPNSQIKIPRSAIVYAHSGETDCNGKSIIGHLHNAIKPANQLKLLEDALVIFRITRAPERRIFYIDVGNMNTRKASQYVNGIMNNFKNRVVYDSATGTIKNQKHNLSMTEDYWLMRRDGKTVTQVDTLQGAQMQGQMDDVRWFYRQLFLALKIPLSRMPKDDGGVIIGGSGTDITRDELDFVEFIGGLRHQFEEILLDPLKTNLVLKKIITEAEWDEEINNISIDFHENSYFQELKETEMLERRISIMNDIAPFIGVYVSHDYVMRNILQLTEEQIRAQQEQITVEEKNPRFKKLEEEDDPI